MDHPPGLPLLPRFRRRHAPPQIVFESSPIPLLLLSVLLLLMILFDD